MLECRDVTFLLSKQEDEPMTWWEKTQVKAHLCICPRCRAFVHNQRHLQQFTQEFAQYLESRDNQPSPKD